MSRIAGLVCPGAPADCMERALDGMLSTFPGARRIKAHRVGAALGWAGGRPAHSGGAFRDHRLWVAMDGCVLNSKELGKSVGRDLGDAGLIAGLYRRYGFARGMQLLHGDFAVALYDADRQALCLGRDRFGVKPLYYAATEGGLAFASQPGALLSLPEVTPEVNRAFVARFAGSHYRTFDNAPTESPFARIKQVPASSIMVSELAAPTRPELYWQLEDREDWREDEHRLADRYHDLLLHAVSRRVAIAGRSAFTLSGGLDSSSVLCCAVEATTQKQQAVSIVYTDRTFDERDEIQDVVAEKVSGWDAVELPDRVDVMDLVARMVRIHDEPVATATWLSHLEVCERVAASDFEALFGGLGGDELNAGEYEYFPLFFADLKQAGQGGRLEREIAAWSRHHDHPIHRKDPVVAKRLMADLTDPHVPGRCLPERGRMLRYAHAVRPEYFDLSEFEPVMDVPFTSYLKNRCFQDMFRETLPCCLRAADRQCTARGIAHYEPFLDHELVEFMYRVPGTLKIRDGVTKRLLRRAMRGLLPEATRTRIKKTGWNAPAHRWFSGDTLEGLRDLVASRGFREYGIYDVAAVGKILDEHQRIVESGAGEENHMMFLWQLVNLCLWLESLGQTGRPAT